jgi:hypothetical protein
MTYLTPTITSQIIPENVCRGTYNVRRYGDEAKAAAKEKVYECHIESHQNLKKAGRVLKLFTDDRHSSQQQRTG